MTAPADLPARASTPAPVWSVGLGLLAVHLLFWGWALFPSYFYGDDYAMLYQARDGLSLDYLAEPYGIHIMPFGRVIVSLVGATGVLNWPVAAAITLIMQVLAGLSCLWMLITLFGRRWGVLGLYAVFLTCAIATPAQMWWVAALNQVPQQIAICLAVGAWVNYLRSRRILWLAISMAATLFGIASYVKSALILPLLAGLLLAYFVSGSPRQRVTTAVRRYWPGLVGAGVVGLALVWAYTQSVQEVGSSSGKSDPWGLADTMLISGLGTGVLGGPWRWWEPNPPVALADPPLILTHLSWIALAAIAGYLALRRQRTGRAWLLFAGYSLGSFLLLAGSRAQVVGAIAGMEFRYLTDTAVIFPLCLGLASMRLLDAPESSIPRAPAVLRIRVPPRAIAAATVLVALSGLINTGIYVRYWHTDNLSQTYVDNLRNGAADGRLDLADAVVPEVVIPRPAYPENLISSLSSLLDEDIHFPKATAKLGVLDDQGIPRVALIGEGPRGRSGPVDGCGWQLKNAAEELTIPLTSETFAFEWWVRLGYLSSSSSPVTIQGGESTVTADLHSGLNSLYVRLQGPFDEISITGLDDGVTLCVDIVEVGDPLPGEVL